MDLDESLLHELREFIDSGVIFVDEKYQIYTSEISDLFPFSGTDVAWSQVSGSVQGYCDKDEYVKCCGEFFDKIDKLENLSGDVILIVDGAIDAALIMDVKIFRKCIEIILPYPLHHYIYSQNFLWCMTFRATGHVGFGYSTFSDEKACS